MLFNTPQFVLILTAFLICWFMLPGKCKKPALLLFSYYYAWVLGGFLTAAALAAVTLITYFGGILLSGSRHRKAAVLGSSALLAGLLIYDKYAPFLSDQLNSLREGSISLTAVSMIGISYYVFSAISYLADLYRGDDEPDRSLFDIAVWLAFFPKIIAGPIERHRHFKQELTALPGTKFDHERLKRGLLICACGYFYKIIIADRISIFTGSVYYNYSEQYGFTLLITVLLYSLQVYFDFAGYSMIAYGIAYAIGLKVVRNFDHPFFTQSISEFWSRWHISLSSWLKDYVYIPLGGSRRGKLRRDLNILLTFLVSALWHGTGWHYVVWGLLNGMLQIIERPFKRWEKLPKYLNFLMTYLLFSFTMIFFKARTLQIAKTVIRRLFYWNPEVITDGTLTCFSLDFPDWIVMLIAMGIALAAEILQYNGISLYKKLQERHIVIRWAVYFLILLVLIVFGKYGAGYSSSDFIYYKF